MYQLTRKLITFLDKMKIKINVNNILNNIFFLQFIYSSNVQAKLYKLWFVCFKICKSNDIQRPVKNILH